MFCSGSNLSGILMEMWLADLSRPDTVKRIVFIKPCCQFPRDDNPVLLFQRLIKKIRNEGRDLLVSGNGKFPGIAHLIMILQPGHDQDPDRCKPWDCSSQPTRAAGVAVLLNNPLFRLFF